MVETIASINNSVIILKTFNHYIKNITFKFADDTIPADGNDESDKEWRTFGSLREKLNKFIEDCPIDTKKVLIYPDNDNHIDADIMVRGFANYDDMTEKWTSTWPTLL